MKRTLIAVGAALLATTACTTSNDATVDPATLGPMSTPTTAMPYVMMAGSGDLFEIESSRLALERSNNDAVRQFAQMLITHHTQLTNATMAAAREAGLNPPPPSLLPHHAEMLDRLRAAPSADFDRMYREEQITAHQEALNLHRTYAESGDEAPLRTSASSAVPIIQQHLAQAQTLPAQAAVPPASAPAPQPTYTPPPNTAGERG